MFFNFSFKKVMIMIQYSLMEYHMNYKKNASHIWHMILLSFFNNYIMWLHICSFYGDGIANHQTHHIELCYFWQIVLEMFLFI